MTLIYKLTLYALVGVIVISSCSEDNTNDPENGDLNNTFNNQESDFQNEALLRIRDSLRNIGYNEEKLSSGPFPNCYNFTPKYSEINNYLKISVGNNTDVAVKIMDSDTDECIRFVYVNSGTSYKAKNIPEGIYHLKIAYGTDWFSRIRAGQCEGKFTKYALYKIGENQMDYNITEEVSKDGIRTSTPYFEISLDIEISDTSAALQTNTISEEEFNL